MKIVRLVLAAMVGVSLLGASAMAAEGAGSEQRRRNRQHRMERRKDLFERLVKELDLSADQQAQVKQIIETHNQAVENWRKEKSEDLETLREQMEKARKAEDAEALKTLREKVTGIFKGRRELQEAMHKQIKEVLTKEQNAKAEKMFQRGLRAVMGAGMIHRALGQLDLSDEQKEKIRKIHENYRDKMKNAKPEERRELMEKMREEMNSVLTDEQKAKAGDLRNRMFQRPEDWAGLNLTDEQKARIKEIRENCRKQIDSVLTDEQKAKIKERREERMKQWRNRQGRRGRGGGGGLSTDED
ncbi:MAG: hypothetical protein SVV80_03540 [Planctomycetota bacterium]|nr:hypothetical protein [Planctomycetota bacterium]